MSQKALSMRKIKEVLRLRYDLGLLQNEIARSSVSYTHLCSSSAGTSGFSRTAGVGAASRMALQITAELSPRKGNCPVAVSYTHLPFTVILLAHQSAARHGDTGQETIPRDGILQG